MVLKQRIDPQPHEHASAPSRPATPTSRPTTPSRSEDRPKTPTKADTPRAATPVQAESRPKTPEQRAATPPARVSDVVPTFELPAPVVDDNPLAYERHHAFPESFDRSQADGVLPA